MACVIYRIYSAIDGVFLSLEWLQIAKSVLWNLAMKQVLPFPNNLKDLDSSYKMDVGFGIVLEGKKLYLITEEIR